MRVVVKLHHAPVGLDASIRALEVHKDGVEHESVHMSVGMLAALHPGARAAPRR
jgi:hypothetical protein